MSRSLAMMSTAAVCAIAMSVFAADVVDRAPLTVIIDPPIEYRNARGDRLSSRYGRLSDDSLHFVKVRLPDGKEITLPLAVSASGARYTDERQFVWWEHPGKARIEARGPDGAWTIEYEGLEPVDRLRP